MYTSPPSRFLRSVSGPVNSKAYEARRIRTRGEGVDFTTFTFLEVWGTMGSVFGSSYPTSYVPGGKV